MSALTVNFNSIINLSDEQFFQLCQINELIRFERNADGTLVLMPLVGGTTSIRNASLTAQLGMWNRDDKLGIGFDSSTGFTLSNGAVRSALRSVRLSVSALSVKQSHCPRRRPLSLFSKVRSALRSSASLSLLECR